MIVIIDHFDSYVHSLARYVGLCGQKRQVIRYDDITADWLDQAKPRGIILSPGPGHPKDYPLTLDIIRDYGPHIPILGVCLGHQAIGFAYGADIIKTTPCHGQVSAIHHQQNDLFHNIPTPFEAARYHSLSVHNTENTPLLTTGRNEEGLIMALQHEKHPIYGVQFHPESCLTEYGNLIIENYIQKLDI